jgi:hypothetical protein
VLVKITTTNICGSDMHMYEGRTDLESSPTNCRSNGPRRAINTSMPVTTDGPRSSSIRRAMRQPAPVRRATIMTIGPR